MSVTGPFDQVSPPVVGDLLRLLDGGTWSTRDGALLETESVSVWIIPCPPREADCNDISITVRPRGYGLDTVGAIPLVLRPTDDDQLTYYGRLDRRGQILFRGVRPGVYRTTIPRGERT